MFQKYGTFYFGYQFWFLDLTIIIFTKLVLCNIFEIIIIKFLIYIEGSMSIFIIYIGILRPLFHFDCINFKVSLVIKIINFKGIFKMAYHLCLSSSMWMGWLVKILIYHTSIASSLEKKSFIFWNKKFQLNHMASKHDSIYWQLS